MRTDQDGKLLSMISGHIHVYDVLIQNDIVVVTTEEGIVTKQKVQGLNEFLVKAKDIRLGWGFFPDFEVIYIYDRGRETSAMERISRTNGEASGAMPRSHRVAA